MPTFTVQRQMYHRAGSLLPLANDDHKFLQVYVMGNNDEQIDRHCQFNTVLNEKLHAITSQLQKEITLKTNMPVQLQHDTSAELFAKQLLDIGNGKMSIDESTHCVPLPTNFCKITVTKDELVHKVFPNIAQNYTNHQWLNCTCYISSQKRRCQYHQLQHSKRNNR